MPSSPFYPQTTDRYRMFKRRSSKEVFMAITLALLILNLTLNRLAVEFPNGQPPLSQRSPERDPNCWATPQRVSPPSSGELEDKGFQRMPNGRSQPLPYRLFHPFK